MYTGTITNSTGTEQVVRARTLGEAVDRAMDTSRRRAGAVVLISAAGEPGMPEGRVLDVAYAGRGFALRSYASRMPEREGAAVVAEADVTAETAE